MIKREREGRPSAALFLMFKMLSESRNIARKKLGPTMMQEESCRLPTAALSLGFKMLSESRKIAMDTHGSDAARNRQNIP